MTRILHVAVNTGGDQALLDRCRRFWDGVLGLDEAPRPDLPGIPGHWLAAGDGQVHLVGVEPGGPGVDPVGPHLCLGVTDLPAAEAELHAAGLETVAAGEGARRQVWVADPSGFTVELQQDPGPAGR